MNFDFGFLDYIWRGLVVMTVTASLVLLVMLAVSSLMKKRISSNQTKWYFHLHFLLLATILIAEFVFVSWADPELASGCFARFVSQEGMFTATRFLSGVWLAGFAGLTGLDLLRTFVSVRVNRSLSESADDRIRVILQELMRLMRIPKAVEISTTSRQVSPYVLGLLRHRVVMNAEFAQNTSSENLRNILAHELIHVRDRDSLWMLAERFCRRILFFHPLMTSLSARYGAIVERAADEQAVQLGKVSSGSLLKTLLEVADRFSIRTSTPFEMGVSAGFKEMRVRIESLSRLNADQKKFGRAFWGIALGSFVASLGISVAQAEIATQARLAEDSEVGYMCTQVKHEKIIESLLMIERETNMCEE